MFCENCGRKSNPGEMFCADCGTPFRTNVNVNPVPAPNLGQVNMNKKKPKTGLILGIVFGVIAVIVAIVVGIVAFAFSFKDTYETKQYIELGSDKIPTVYSAVGQKSLVSFNTQINGNGRTTTLEYYADDFTEDELLEYFASLEDDGFSLSDDTTNIFMYVKESADSGKLLFVYGNKDYANNTIVFDYVKTSGNIDDYITKDEDKSNEDTIRVGAAGYGYIDVPESVERYYGTTSNDDVLQYSNASKSLLITLSCVEDSQYTVADYVAYYADDYEKGGATVKIGNETVAGYNAYTILATSEDGWISKEWLFIDENNNLYYVYMGTYDDTYIFDYIDTYKTQS